jgi:alpha-glucuronidase
VTAIEGEGTDAILTVNWGYTNKPEHGNRVFREYVRKVAPDRRSRIQAHVNCQCKAERHPLIVVDMDRLAAYSAAKEFIEARFFTRPAWKLGIVISSFADELQRSHALERKLDREQYKNRRDQEATP